MLVLSKFRDLLWGKPPADPKEAKLLRKIDLFVLPFVCLNYWVNYLDRTNFSNAYVSGLREDVGLVRAQYTNINSIFTAGYTIAMLAHNIALLKFPPRYWLTFCSLSWGLLTLGLYRVEHYWQLCVIRFFQAVFEASTFVGTHYILGNWYKDTELTKRSAVFTSSGLIGSIFSGFMQTAIHRNMDGKGGLAGWRWLFIIDFIITIPVSIYGLLCFPDTPDNCHCFFFSDEDKQLAQDRLPPREHTKLDWSLIKRVVGRWHWWLFSLLWIIGGENESYCVNSLLALWLQYFDYPISARNNYPMGMYAVGIVSTFGCALYVDGTGAKYHWHVAIWITLVMLISTILLLAKPLSESYFMAGNLLAGVSYSGQATYFAWVNVLCYNDLQERAVILASMNMFSNAFNAGWPLLFYRATDVPRFRKGCYAMLATIFTSLIIAATIRFMQIKEERNRDKVTYAGIEATAESDSKEVSDVQAHSLEKKSVESI